MSHRSLKSAENYALLQLFRSLKYDSKITTLVTKEEFQETYHFLKMYGHITTGVPTLGGLIAIRLSSKGAGQGEELNRQFEYAFPKGAKRTAIGEMKRAITI